MSATTSLSVRCGGRAAPVGPSARTPDHFEVSPTERRRVIGATIVGTTIEWYDFFIYAFAANLVFGTLFFEPAGEGLKHVLALLTIGLSFLFRPFGAFLTGHFGDKIGRRPMLVITLLLMGVATTCVGLLPTHATIGIAAPIMLMFLRVLQGMAAGGEWGGAALMSVEHAGPGQRGRFGMYPQLGVPAGMLLASGALALMTTIAPGDAFLSWGWRVPFLASFLLIAVGMYIRSQVSESPVFEHMRETAQRETQPIAVLMKSHWKLVLTAALVFVGNNAVGYMVTGGFVQGLASRPPSDGGLGYNPTHVQLAVLVAAVVWMVFTFIAGILSDRIGRRPTYLIGYALLAAAVIPLFLFVDMGVIGVLIGCCLLSVGLGFTYGPQSAWYAETFPASVRFSGVSISYAIGAVLGGAFAPSIAQTLLQQTGTTWAIVGYLLVTIAVATTGALLLRDRPGIPLDAEFEESGEWETWKPAPRPATA